MQWTFAVLFAAIFVFLNVSALRRQRASFIRVQPAPSRRAVRERDRAQQVSGIGGEQRLAAPDDLAAGWVALSDGDPDSALATADRVIASQPYPEVSRRAGELRAWAFLQLRRPDDAQAALDALPPGRKASRYLRAAVAATTGAGTPPLVEAFLFGGSGPDRQRAAIVAADWGLLDALVADLLREGENGRVHARDLGTMLGEARPGAAERVAALLGS
jgi:hypothetical protein